MNDNMDLSRKEYPALLVSLQRSTQLSYTDMLSGYDRARASH